MDVQRGGVVCCAHRLTLPACVRVQTPRPPELGACHGWARSNGWVVQPVEGGGVGAVWKWFPGLHGEVNALKPLHVSVIAV